MTISLESMGYRKASQNLADIITAEDATQEQLALGISELAQAVSDEVTEQYRTSNDDKRVLESRGFRTLTNEEEAYYGKFIESARTSRTRQDFVASMADADIPATVIDEVMDSVKHNHPLLAMIQSRAVGRITKMFFNTGAAQVAVWGELDGAIVTEITGGFREVDAEQKKLSAFAQLSRDELELGPEYINELVVTTLGESIANGLEKGVADGDGLHGPIGLDRDIHKGVNFSTTTGYPLKSAGNGLVSMADFSRASVDAIMALMATDESGNQKNFAVTAQGDTIAPAIGFAVNLTDWFGKVDEAAHIMGTGGDDKLAPGAKMLAFVQSAFVPSGKAIAFIPSEYMLLVAGDRGLEASDDFKFLDDKRVYKYVMYGAGMCKDNTSAVLVDISKLAALVPTVNTKAVTEG